MAGDDQLPFLLEVCCETLDKKPFFETRSPFPFSIAVGDEIDGDPVFSWEEQKLPGYPKHFKVSAVRHFLFTTAGARAKPNESLPARGLRVAVVPIS